MEIVFIVINCNSYSIMIIKGNNEGRSGYVNVIKNSQSRLRKREEFK